MEHSLNYPNSQITVSQIVEVLLYMLIPVTDFSDYSPKNQYNESVMNAASKSVMVSNIVTSCDL